MNKAQVVESHEQVKRDSYSSLDNTHPDNHIQLNYIDLYDMNPGSKPFTV